MATIKDKQSYNVKMYIKRLTERREALVERKEYILENALKNAERKRAAANPAPTVPGAEGGEDTSSVGSVVLNGQLPTIAQYKGPDVHKDKLIGGNVYQSGIKAKLEGTDKWNKDIMEQAAKAGVNPLLVKVIMATESGGTHKSTPNAYDCVGLMQVMGSLVRGMGLDWNKAKNDPVYNIFCGCKALIEKHNDAKRISGKGTGDLYNSFKSRGYPLKPTVHGAAWLYNGFSMPSPGSNKVTSGGVVYANQVVGIYGGFGRDGNVDTVLSLDVLGGGTASTSTTTTTPQAGSQGAGANSLMAKAAPVGIADQIITRELLSPEEEYFMIQRNTVHGVPVGKMNGRYFESPRYSRSRYVENRKMSLKFREKTGYAPLPALDFRHLGGPQENYYAEEARAVFRHLKERLGNGQLIISRGFDPEADAANSSHSAGIAMDIYAGTPDEAIKIADTAWLLGIRAIAIGPKFVHVDTGPEAVWGYDKLAVYRGPGTVRREGLAYGYK